MSAAASDAARITLRLQLAPAPDALARVLDVVLSAQARPRSVSHLAETDCGWSLLDLECGSPMRAQTLASRLAGLACVEQLQRVR